jgi:hypothetical protein
MLPPEGLLTGDPLHKPDDWGGISARKLNVTEVPERVKLPSASVAAMTVSHGKS